MLGCAHPPAEVWGRRGYFGDGGPARSRPPKRGNRKIERCDRFPISSSLTVGFTVTGGKSRVRTKLRAYTDARPSHNGVLSPNITEPLQHMASVR